MDFEAIDTQSIEAAWLAERDLILDVLRLDKIHPIISGNKYFKLKYYLQDALTQNKNTVATFGGAWSNHIVATAYACCETGLQSVGFIRGERPTVLSHTLQDAEKFGMHLRFVSRAEYRNKENIKANHNDEDWYWVKEGGYGVTGAKGASEILKTVDTADYSHIIAAVGTGTMLAGLLLSSKPEQHIIGVSSMKGNSALAEEIKALTEQPVSESKLHLLHQYHFSGYGKHPEQLIDYINFVYHEHQLPLDIVYTGKAFYAVEDLVKQDFFPAGSKLLMIHSGGLQGNNSLPPKVLAF